VAPPVTLTLHAVLRELQARYGLALIDEGPCPGGEVGARYARGQRGEQFVYKWLEGHTLAWATTVVDGVTRLRANGYPATRYLRPFDLDSFVVLVQERAPGQWSDQVDELTIAAVLAAHDRQAGLGWDGTSWHDYIVMTLTEGAEGYCLHQTLRDAGGECGAILDWVRSVGRSVGHLHQGDLVHLDLHHRNVLQDGSGGITIIDLEGVQPGDRAFDLVTFGIYLDYSDARSEAEEQIFDRAATLTAVDDLRAYVAHMALRRLDWTLRFHPDDLEAALRAVRRAMARVA
jgi:hypothetical protein